MIPSQITRFEAEQRDILDLKNVILKESNQVRRQCEKWMYDYEDNWNPSNSVNPQ